MDAAGGPDGRLGVVAVSVNRFDVGAVANALRASHGLAVGAALVTVAAAGVTPVTRAAAVAGLVLLVAGLARHSRGLVGLGGVALFGSAVLTAGQANGVLVVLLAAFGAVLAADFAEFALGLARDVDDSVTTTRVELLHAVGSLTVAVLTGGVGYALFRSVPQGTTVGVAALLFAAVVLAALLRA